jgi:diguanylate cyclase
LLSLNRAADGFAQRFMRRGQTLTSEVDAQFQRSVRIDKLQLLYRQSSHAVFGSLVAGILWATIVWSHPNEASRTGVSLWLLVFAAIAAIRLTVLIAYRRKQPEGEATFKWFTPYVATLLLSSAVWGFGTVWVVPTDSQFLLVVTYVFAVGLAGLALSNYGVYVWLALLIAALVLTPAAVALLSRGDMESVLLAIAGLWFIGSATRGLTVHNKAVDESFRLAHELRRATQIAQWQAQMDGLTGLKNRNAFIDAADAVIQVVARDRQHASMLAIDIDGFKQVNDKFGHAAGDTALVEVAEVFRTVLRRSDICGRLGGDEFAVLLPNTPHEAALSVAEKLRATVEREEIVFNDCTFTVTLSIGVASGESDAEALLLLADNAMYQAKNNGRNQVAERQTITA